MSELRTNKIVPRDGLPSGADGGGIIQMVQGEVTDFLQTSSSSYVDAGLSASITPTSSSNKILVNMALGVYGGATDTLRVNAQVLRGSTQVWYYRNLFFRSSGDFKSVQSAIQFIDSPATTSSTIGSIDPTPTIAEAAMHLWPAHPDIDAATLFAVIDTLASGKTSR